MLILSDYVKKSRIQLARDYPYIAGGSNIKWQAVEVVFSRSISRGARFLQVSCTFGHLGWKAHPEGGSIGDGTSPVIIWRSDLLWGSGIGIADIKDWV